MNITITNINNISNLDNIQVRYKNNKPIENDLQVKLNKIAKNIITEAFQNRKPNEIKEIKVRITKNECQFILKSNQGKTIGILRHSKKEFNDITALVENKTGEIKDTTFQVISQNSVTDAAQQKARGGCGLIDVISQVAKRALNQIKEFFSHFSSPFSFFRGKHEFKGYKTELKTFESEVKEKHPGLKDGDPKLKKIAQEEAKQYLLHCSATIACFKQDKKWVEPFGFKFFNPKEAHISVADISETMQVKDDCFFDPYTGVKAIILEKDNEVVVCFGSLHTGDYEFKLPEQQQSQGADGTKEKEKIDEKKAAKVRERQMQSVHGNLLGLKSKTYDQADLLYQKIASLPQFQGKKISLAGQCFGGSLASYVSLKNKVPAICFNTFPLGVGQQEKIGPDMLHKADEYITHVSAETDYVSDNRKVAFIDWILTSLRIRSPGNFGKRFVIPSAYSNSDATHAYIQGSLMNYLGHDKRANPADLKAAGHL
jgi:hypothetical protein